MIVRTGLVSLALGLLIAGNPLAAQQVEVGANVPVRSPTGAGVRTLTFGMLTPLTGTTQTVNVVAAVAPVSGTVQSGEFRYNVAGLRGVTFTVSVPAELTASGASPLTVSFNGAQFGGYCVTSAASCTLTSFNPAAGANIRVCRVTLPSWCNPFTPYAGGNQLRVYVGGLLSVPPTARAGVYSGTVTLSIVQVH
jgi:hypothetical protein